jgi:hypothetical protein
MKRKHQRNRKLFSWRGVTCILAYAILIIERRLEEYSKASRLRWKAVSIALLHSMPEGQWVPGWLAKLNVWWRPGQNFLGETTTQLLRSRVTYVCFSQFTPLLKLPRFMALDLADSVRMGRHYWTWYFNWKLLPGPDSLSNLSSSNHKVGCLG